MWELNPSKSTGGNSDLLFCDDTYVFCTYCKFESRTIPNQNSALWVTWELNSSLDSEVHSGSLRTERPEASFPRHKWGEHLTLHKVPETTHTSSFPMNLMCSLHSATLSCAKHEWHEDSACQKIPETTHSSCFYADIYILYTFCKVQPCTTQDKFSPSWVMWERNSSKSAGGNSYLPFYDVLSPIVTLVGHTTSSLRYERLENSVFQKIPNTGQTYCSTMILMSLVNSASFSRVRRKTSFFRHDWHEKSLQKMVGTTHTSWLTIILMSLVHSVSFSWYDAGRTFFIMGHWIARFFKGL